MSAPDVPSRRTAAVKAAHEDQSTRPRALSTLTAGWLDAVLAQT